jgi:hypothetical protein
MELNIEKKALSVDSFCTFKLIEKLTRIILINGQTVSSFLSNNDPVCLPLKFRLTFLYFYQSLYTVSKLSHYYKLMFIMVFSAIQVYTYR